MASYYKRKDSPYYWVGVMRPDGRRKYRATKIRHDQPGALRRILEYVRGLEKEEHMARNEDGRQLFKAWERAAVIRWHGGIWICFSGSGMFSIREKWIITC